MKITIIGAGAMGSLFGSLLARSGQEVLLIDIWQEHIDAINTKGLGISKDEDTTRIPVMASSQVPETRDTDLVIIFVKSTQTRQAAAQAAKCLSDQGVVLTLQNGMGNADIISEFVDPGRVIAGTTSHGATLLEPGLIRHAGSGPTLIGMWSEKDSTCLDPIKEMFIQAGFETQVEENIHQVIWKKLIINVGINAITALTGIKNGGIVDSPPTGTLVRAAVAEACEVAQACGITLPTDIADTVFTVAKATAANRSSMGQDVDHQRQTEIDAINGAVAALAQDKNMDVPVNQTLTALIKTMQKNY